MPCLILVTVKLKAQRLLKNEEHIFKKCALYVWKYTRTSYSNSICILGSEWFIWPYLMNQKQRSFVLRSEGRRGGRDYRSSKYVL
jgi:hypothetical protein